jgi:hypothetical protein
MTAGVPIGRGMGIGQWAGAIAWPPLANRMAGCKNRDSWMVFVIASVLEKQESSQKLMRPTLYNEELVDQVLAAIRDGANQKHAAALIGVNENTITNWKKSHPEFAEQIQRARHYATLAVEVALHRSAVNGNFNAQKFWLTNRAGDEWKNKPTADGERTIHNTFEEWAADITSKRRQAVPPVNGG